jgi:hypothetical protein
MIVKTPDRTYNLGEKGLPSFDQKVVSWPWGGTPSLTKWSVDALKYPLGTIIVDVIDGHPVIAQIQTHDTYGAHPEWGIKLHKGTSVYVPTVTDGESGKTVAMRDAPDGWGVSTMAGERMMGMRFRRVERHERTSPIFVVDPYVAGAQYIADPSAVVTSPTNSGVPPMPHEDWRAHFSKVPKLAVIAGGAILGAIVSPVGALVGAAVALVADREVRGGPWLPSFHGESREDQERMWGSRYHSERDRARREHRPDPPNEMMRPPPPNALNSWERWQQIHPGTPYQDYMNWVFQYGLNGAQINGEGSWKVKRYDPSTGQFFYVGAVSAGTEGEAMDQATSQLFAASAAKPYNLPGFTNVYITSAGDVFRLGMES